MYIVCLNNVYLMVVFKHCVCLNIVHLIVVFKHFVFYIVTQDGGCGDLF